MKKYKLNQKEIALIGKPPFHVISTLYNVDNIFIACRKKRVTPVYICKNFRIIFLGRSRKECMNPGQNIFLSHLIRRCILLRILYVQEVLTHLKWVKTSCILLGILFYMGQDFLDIRLEPERDLYFSKGTQNIYPHSPTMRK